MLDFYCEAAKLCVEVDGGSHSAGARPLRDEFRDAWLEEIGIRTLRLSAELVLRRVDDAVATIRQALEDR